MVALLMASHLGAGVSANEFWIILVRCFVMDISERFFVILSRLNVDGTIESGFWPDFRKSDCYRTIKWGKDKSGKVLNGNIRDTKASFRGDLCGWQGSKAAA